MALSFSPYTEDEIKRQLILDPGQYNFEVIKAEHRPSSKSGNPMIELTLGVFGMHGQKHLVTDYLMTHHPLMMFKLRHFCHAVGLEKEYQAGMVSAPQCEGLKGSVEIIISKGKPNGDGGFYPDKNSVKDYIPNDPDSVESFKNNVSIDKTSDAFTNDEIPF